VLKNSVPVPEYVLLSEDLYRSGDAALSEPVHEIAEELEGIGHVRTYFVDVEDLAGPLPPPTRPSWPRRVAETVRVLARGVPYMLRPRRRGNLAH
jgi:hypothetical protein